MVGVSIDSGEAFQNESDVPGEIQTTDITFMSLTKTRALQIEQ